TTHPTQLLSATPTFYSTLLYSSSCVEVPPHFKASSRQPSSCGSESVMNVGKLFVAAALLLPIGMDACRCSESPTVCEGVDNADAVIRAVLVSSATDKDGDSFWADTVVKVVEVFKSETGLEQYAVDEEIQVFSPGSTNSCGAWTDFGEEYLVDLLRGDDGLYTVLPCGIYRTWVSLSEDDEDSLRSCSCDGSCGTFQECLPNESGYPVYGGSAEYYCADVCDPTPCGDEEVCELLPVPCATETFCPEQAVCYPATPEPTPASTPTPTPPPTMPDVIISCASWECGAGYTNIERDCSTDPSPYGRRRLRTSLDSGSNEMFDMYSTDGYTTLGNYPMCRQDNCCEESPAPTPSPTDSDVIISCASWECGAGYTNIERDCSTDPSPYGRRRLRTSLDSGSNDVFDMYSTDGYTTLGNYPMCRQDNCCE
ncbi:unnamed protein product, partial [Ectocarpus fasciculatus]